MRCDTGVLGLWNVAAVVVTGIGKGERHVTGQRRAIGSRLRPVMKPILVK